MRCANTKHAERKSGDETVAAMVSCSNWGTALHIGLDEKHRTCSCAVKPDVDGGSLGGARYQHLTDQHSSLTQSYNQKKLASIHAYTLHAAKVSPYPTR